MKTTKHIQRLLLTVLCLYGLDAASQVVISSTNASLTMPLICQSPFHADRTIVGSTYEESANNKGYLLSEINAAGDVTWQKFLHSTTIDQLYWIDAEPGNALYLGGSVTEGAEKKAVVSKIDLAEIQITKRLDSGSPQVYSACNNGKFTQQGLFVEVKQAGGKSVYMKLDKTTLSVNASRVSDSTSLANDADIPTGITEVPGTGVLFSGSCNVLGLGQAAVSALFDYNLNLIWNTSVAINIGTNNRAISSCATFDPAALRIYSLINLEAGPELIVLAQDLAGNTDFSKTRMVSMPGGGDLEGYSITFRPAFYDIIITGFQRNAGINGDFNGDGVGDGYMGRIPFFVQCDATTLNVLSARRYALFVPPVADEIGAPVMGYPRSHYPRNVLLDTSGDVEMLLAADFNQDEKSDVIELTLDNSGLPIGTAFCLYSENLATTLLPTTLVSFAPSTITPTSAGNSDLLLSEVSLSLSSSLQCPDQCTLVLNQMTTTQTNHNVLQVSAYQGIIQGELTVNWGDGNSDVCVNCPSPGVLFWHSYEAPGIYVVVNEYTDAQGQSCSRQHTLEITCADFPQEIYWQPTGNPGEIEFFNPGSEPFMGYVLDFGDGQSSNEVNTVHSYAISGTYEVCMHAYCLPEPMDEVLVCFSVEVEPFCPALPEAPFYVSAQGLDVVLAAWPEYISEEYFIFNIAWGDGTVTANSGFPANASLLHSYSEPGDYAISVSLECMITGEINQYNFNISASQLPCPCCPGGTIPWTLIVDNYNESASVYVNGHGSSVVVVKWGDGDVSTLNDDGNITHDYETCGPFTLTIEVYCNNILLEASTYTVELNFCSPYPDGVIPGFVATLSANGLAGHVVYSGPDVDNDNDEIVFCTNWGDGGDCEPCDDYDCTHTYAQPGTYTVCAVAMHTSGITQTVCTQLTVFSPGISLTDEVNGCTLTLKVDINLDAALDWVYIVNWADGHTMTIAPNCEDTDDDGIADNCTPQTTGQTDEDDSVEFYTEVIGDEVIRQLRISHSYDHDGLFPVTFMRAEVDSEGGVTVMDLKTTVKHILFGCDAPCELPKDFATVQYRETDFNFLSLWPVDELFDPLSVEDLEAPQLELHSDLHIEWSVNDEVFSNAPFASRLMEEEGIYYFKMTAVCGNTGETVVKERTVNLQMPVCEEDVYVFSRFDAVVNGNIMTPFSGNPEKEREAIIQQTFWLYDYGDGHTSTTPNAPHTYTYPGEYVVTQTYGVLWADGVYAEDTYTQAIRIDCPGDFNQDGTRSVSDLLLFIAMFGQSCGPAVTE